MSGCSAAPPPTASPRAPSPSASGFASDEEAFAAAEQTYRNYVDALNQVDLSDPSTFEAVYAWTTGDANLAERANLEKMHDSNLHVEGRTIVSAFRGISAAPTKLLVTAHVCTDITEVRVSDQAGNQLTDGDRPNGYTLEVQFQWSAESPSGSLISSSTAIEANRCAL